MSVQTLRSYWSRLRQHRLITTASVYVSGYVLQKSVSFLLIPIWARFLTPRDYGITGTLLAYGGVLATVLGLGLSGAVVRHYYDYTADRTWLNRYITSVILFQIVGPGLVVVALDVWGPALWARFTANTIPFYPYVRVMLWATYVDMLSQIPIALYQAQQRAKQFVYVQYSRFLLGVATSVLFVIALQLGALGVLLSQLVAGTLVSATVIYLVGRTWFTRHISLRYVREALGYGLPLVPHTLASWVLQAADRLILERHVSLTELGLYNFGYTLGMSMQFLVMGINQAWMPHYFRLMKADPGAKKKVVRVTSIYIALVGGACLFGVLFAGEIIRLLMPASFWACCALCAARGNRLSAAGPLLLRQLAAVLPQKDQGHSVAHRIGRSAQHRGERMAGAKLRRHGIRMDHPGHLRAAVFAGIPGRPALPADRVSAGQVWLFHRADSRRYGRRDTPGHIHHARHGSQSCSGDGLRGRSLPHPAQAAERTPP